MADISTFRVAVEVLSRDGSRAEAVEALVDTGAFYTLLPAPLLHDLGHSVAWREAFRLADGRSIELGVVEAVVRYDGRERTTPIVFGPDDARPLLGAFTLEAFALTIDPRRGELVQAELTL